MTAGMDGNWGGAGGVFAVLANPMFWRNAKDKSIQHECHRLRGLMVKAFNEHGPPGKKWKALSVFTQLLNRARKKGDRHPLLDTGDMRNSHSVVKDGDVWFVGIHRTAQGRKSKLPMVNLGIIHEHGTKAYTIRVTDDMRYGFFYWAHYATRGQIKKLKPTTTHIVVRIPPRPWIGPIWEQEQDRSGENIVNGIVAEIPGFGFMR